MFFSEVEGHMQKLSSFGRGKKFGQKSHLHGPSTQPFDYSKKVVTSNKYWHYSCYTSTTVLSDTVKFHKVAEKLHC